VQVNLHDNLNSLRFRFLDFFSKSWYHLFLT
jgi:hypothetical protein